MPTILAVNPAPKGKGKRRESGAKKKGKTMAKRQRNKLGQFKKKGGGGSKKKKTTRTKTKTKTIVKYRNPSTAKKAAKASGRYARRTIAGVNMGGAVRSVIPLFLGFCSAQFVAKKFGDVGGATENWSWKEYLLGPLGGFLVAAATSAVFKAKGPTAQKVFEGALAYTMWQFWRNEVIVTNDTLEEWFGEDDYDLPLYDGIGADEDDWIHPDYQGVGEDDEAEPGDLWDEGDGNYQVLGADYKWRPIDDMQRVAGMGDSVTPFNPTMGDSVTPFNPTMGDIVDKYDKAYGLQ